MRHAGTVLVVWGAWLGVLTTALIPFTGIRGPFGVHAIEAIKLGGSAFACAAVGSALWVADARRRRVAECPQLVTENSFATATLIARLSLVLLGAGFGLWLVL